MGQRSGMLSFVRIKIWSVFCICSFCKEETRWIKEWGTRRWVCLSCLNTQTPPGSDA